MKELGKRFCIFICMEGTVFCALRTERVETFLAELCDRIGSWGSNLHMWRSNRKEWNMCLSNTPWQTFNFIPLKVSPRSLCVKCQVISQASCYHRFLIAPGAGQLVRALNIRVTHKTMLRVMSSNPMTARKPVLLFSSVFCMRCFNNYRTSLKYYICFPVWFVSARFGFANACNIFFIIQENVHH